MRTDTTLVLAAAILGGCALIATALYLGLAHTSPVAHEPVAKPPSNPVATPPAATMIATTPKIATPTAAQAHAAEAIAYHRGLLLARCPPPADTVFHFQFNITFDAHGQQVMRGIADDRRNPTSTLAQCLNEALPGLRIPPPGTTMAVDVPLQLP